MFINPVIAATQGASNFFTSIVSFFTEGGGFMIIIIVAMLLLMIIPQRKREKKVKQMINKNDKELLDRTLFVGNLPSMVFTLLSHE